MESRLEYLFEHYVNEKCSGDEEKELMELLAKSENEPQVKALLKKMFEHEDPQIQMTNQVADVLLKNILEKGKTDVVSIQQRGRQFTTWMRVAAAAVIILFVSAISYWFVAERGKDNIAASIRTSETKKTLAILPGGNHATLTLADGSTITLDSVKNGSIKGGSAIINKKGGLLVYDASRSKAGAPVSYNTLTTPRGGQYQVVLPDGSKVWLNASSSLHFPTAFIGKDREVELTGEAYFEVAKNKNKPFHVKVDGMQIEVLGTHFNVNAYPDENDIKTTLLEGSVKLKSGSASGLLQPGQQGILDKDPDKSGGYQIEIKNANMDEVMAWKNRLFQFDGDGIETIMREISRWYNVDIVYSGKVPKRSFEGKISRDAPLSDVLKILELSNVKFNVEGKKIVVE